MSPEILGHQNRSAHRKAGNQHDHQVGHLTAHVDPGQRFGGTEHAHNQHVGHAVQRLKQVGQQERQAELYQMLGDIALGKILLQFAQWNPLPHSMAGRQIIYNRDGAQFITLRLNNKPANKLIVS